MKIFIVLKSLNSYNSIGSCHSTKEGAIKAIESSGYVKEDEDIGSWVKYIKNFVAYKSIVETELIND